MLSVVRMYTVHRLDVIKYMFKMFEIKLDHWRTMLGI